MISHKSGKSRRFIWKEKKKKKKKTDLNGKLDVI